MPTKPILGLGSTFTFPATIIVHYLMYFFIRESEFTIYFFPFLLLYLDSTHQMLGKYLLFKGLTVTNVEVEKNYINSLREN